MGSRPGPEAAPAVTPAEWDESLRTRQPRPAAEHAWATASVRRRRLFLLAVHLRAGYAPTDPWEQHLVRVAEKSVGGYIGANHLKREAGEAYRRVRALGLAATDARERWFARRVAAAAVLADPDLRPWVLNWQPLEGSPVREYGRGGGRPDADWAALTCDLVRCVLGDPTRPVAWERDWRTTAVTELARAIDADRAYHLLPILADALEDAGCGDPALIAHCRDHPTHARGCWVVDGVLGRAY